MQLTLNFQLTYEAVFEIDRTLRKLKSNLDVLTVTKRVKTYALEDIEASESEDECLASLKRNTSETVVETEKPIEVKDLEVQYVSENSIDDHFVSVNDVGDDDDIKPIEPMDTEASDAKISEGIFDDMTEPEEKKEVSDIEMNIKAKVPKPRRRIIKRIKRPRQKISKITKLQREQALEQQKGSRVKKTHKYNR